MTDNTTIIELPLDSLVQLCLLRQEDVRIAMRKAATIRYRERHTEINNLTRRDYQKKWRADNREKCKEYQKKWRADNREKCEEYQRQYHARNKDRKEPARPEKMTVLKDEDEIYVEPERLTDMQKVKYWNAVLEGLDEKFSAKEIDVETYINESNIAASHVLAAEIRMKKY